jgi:predicted phage tail protein/sugar lactone lactonase YvrE
MRRRLARLAAACLVALLLVLAWAVGGAIATAGDISTVAGNGSTTASGDGGPATSAGVPAPAATAFDSSGNLYIASTSGQEVRKVSPTGIISTVAGKAGTAGFSGDGGPAALAKLSSPTGLAVDTSGNLYIADTGNHRVRKISTAGTITTVVGNGTAGSTGDGGPATSAELTTPVDVKVSPAGDLYIADGGASKIRKVDAGGTISTFAGSGTAGYNGDGIAATAAKLNQPNFLYVSSGGDVYIDDTANNRVRMVDSATGLISTVAGTGVSGYGGDGGAATAAKLSSPQGIVVDSIGDLFISDYNNERIRKVNPSGTITTIAGTGRSGFAGDGGPAFKAKINHPAGLTVNGAGDLLLGDYGNNRVRKILAAATIASPTLSGTTPASPANDNAPLVTGNAPSGTTIRLYTNSTCTSAVAATGDADTFGSTGLPVSVPDDSTTTFWANATDGSSSVSGCSANSATYVEDSTPPATPSITSAPTSPGTGRNPSWSFTGDPSATFECKLAQSLTVVSDWAPCTSPVFYDLLGQPDGTYTFSVRAVDAAGNRSTAATSTYTLDTTPPAAPSITSAPPASSSNANPSWGFTGEAGATFQCKIARGTTIVSDFASCASPKAYDLSGQPDGTYTFSVRAIDSVGNVGAAASSSFTLDRTAPAAPSITSSPGAVGSSRLPSWSFSGEAGATFQCQLSSGATILSSYGSCTSPKSYDLTGRPDGVYTFSVKAIDAAGNVGPAATSTYQLDSSSSSPPTITASPSPVTSNRNASWSFTGVASSYECQLVTGSTIVSAYSPCTSPRSYSLVGQPDGTYTFSVRGIDGAGNRSAQTTSSFVLDTTPPATPTITFSPGPTGNSTNAGWDFTGESGATFQCQLTRGATVVSAYAACTGPKSYDLTGQPDGTYTFSVKAIDAAGNVSQAATSDYDFDTTAPAAPSIDSTPGSPGNSRSPSWSFSGESGATYQCRLLRGSTVVSDFASCASPKAYDLSGQPDGDYTFSVRAVDAAGNVGPASSSSYTLDTSAPAAPSLTGSPPATGNNTRPAWWFTGEAGATLQCQVTRGATVISPRGACTSPATYDLSGQPDGTYTFSVRAVDAAGNASSDTTSDYTLDTAVPSTPSITSSPATPGSGASPAWSFTGDAGATFQCRLMRGSSVVFDYASCTSPGGYDLTGQPDATYTFDVRETDAAGNVSGVAASSYTLDRSAPAAPSIVSSPGTSGSGRNPAWNFTDEAGATFECQLASGATVLSAYAPCTGPKSYDLTGQPDGAYTFSVRATDAAGNTGPATSSDYTLDSTAPPAPSIDSDPGALGSSRSLSWSFSDDPGVTFECQLTNGLGVVSPFGSCSSPQGYSLIGQPDGWYTFSVHAIDGVGNNSSDATDTYVLDTTPPAAPSIDASPDSPGNAAQVAWEFSDEPGATFKCELDRGSTVVSPLSTCSSGHVYDLAGQPDGTYTLSVEAVDAAGNTGPASTSDYAYDTAAPGAPSIDSTPGSLGSSRAPSWSFSGEPGATFECQLSRGLTIVSSYADCASPDAFDLTGQPDGDYTFSVRAVDPAGNVGQAASSTYTLDTTAPATPAIGSGPGALGSSRSPSWSFSGEAGATFECQLARGSTVVDAFASCTSPSAYSLVGQPDGAYTFSVRARDAAGNASGDATSAYTLDTTAPAAPTITSSPPATGSSANPSWSFAGEPGATFQCQLTRGSTVISAFGSCTSPRSYDLTAQPDATYTFTVRAVDAAGNVGPGATSDYAMTRGGPSQPTITSSPGATGNDDQPAWDFSGGSGVTFECEIVRGSVVVSDFAACTGPKSYDLSAEPDGDYTFNVRAVDSLGRPSLPATADYLLDRAAPAAPTITSKPGTVGQGLQPAWDFTGESGARLECQLTRGSTVISDFATCSGPRSYDLTGQPDGTYTFSVRAVDAAGNTGSAASDDYTLDTTAPPVPTITSAPPALGRSAGPAWAFAVAGDATAQCRLNEGNVVLLDFAPCTSPRAYDLSGQSDGSYTFSVRAVDAAGNASAPASSPYALDRLAPVSPVITSAPTSPGRDQTPSFAFTGDADATLRCRLLTGSPVAPAFSDCGSPKVFDLTGSADGTYTFDLEAADAAGNESADIRYAYLLDTTPPAAPTITSRPNSRTADATPTWKWTGEDGATFTCSVSSGGQVVSPFSSCKARRTYDLTAHDDGDYTFKVRATDLAGNEGPVARDTFTLDRSKPGASGGGGSGSAGGAPPAGSPGGGGSPQTSPASTPPASPSAAPSASGRGGGKSPDASRAPRGLAPSRNRVVAPPHAVAKPRPTRPGGGKSRGKSHKKVKHRGFLPTVTEVARVTGKVAEHTAFPAALLLLVAAFMGLQNRIDRNDPKLALAPVVADPELDFEPPSLPEES